MGSAQGSPLDIYHLVHETLADDTVALRVFNDHVVADERVECVMLPISDGLTFIRKR